MVDPISTVTTGSSVLRGLQALTDIAGKLGVSVSGGEAKKQVTELLGIITKLQLNLLEEVTRGQDQAQQIRELRAELLCRADWEAEASNYLLKSTPVDGILYVSKGDSSVDRPKHYLCADCFADRRKAFLQPWTEGAFEMLKCNTCGGKVRLKERQSAGLPF